MSRRVFVLAIGFPVSCKLIHKRHENKYIIKKQAKFTGLLTDSGLKHLEFTRDHHSQHGLIVISAETQALGLGIKL